MACDISHVGTVDAHQVVFAKFFSSTEGKPATGGFIGNSPDDYYDQMNLLGQATTTIASQSSAYDFAGGVPYSTLLRPVTDLTRLYSKACLRLISVEFNAIDTTFVDAEGQDAVVVQQIVDSVDPTAASFSAARAYMQTRFRNGVIGGWQPNWFRPQIFINGTDVLASLSRTAFDVASAGDSSIGQLLPWCLKLDMRVGPVDKKGIEVYAAAYQEVVVAGPPDVVWYQRYAIDCELIFLIEDEQARTCL